MYIFVYGTLKTGFFNYLTYLHYAIDQEDVTCLGSGYTEQLYPLFISPTTRSVPCLVESPGTGHHVEGQVFHIHHGDVLKALDVLEGVSSGFYARQDISISLRKGKTSPLTCGAYFIQEMFDTSGLTMISCYTHALQENYVPRTIAPNVDILALLWHVDPTELQQEVQQQPDKSLADIYHGLSLKKKALE